MERIILPANLQQKIIKSAHTLGHLGTKMKQMLREKYWFPGMNHLISQTIGSCFDCQVATKGKKKEKETRGSQKIRTAQDHCLSPEELETEGSGG